MDRLSKCPLFFAFLFLILHSKQAISEDFHDYGYYKIGKPYMIEGKLFTPKEPTNLIEKGIASWYGNELKNKKTANGATFHPEVRTAAHRTLPMPSAVLIRNIKNGNQTIAIVNDRGPFKETNERIIDVSKKVAEELGFMQNGKAMVEIEYLPILSEKLKNGEDVNIDEYIYKYGIINNTPKVKIAQKTPYTVPHKENAILLKTPFSTTSLLGGNNQGFYTQIGVFSELTNAQNLYERLANTVPHIEIKSTQKHHTTYYVVRSGPFENENIANNTRNIIQQNCHECNPIIVLR